MAISIQVVGNFDDREIKRAQKQLNTLSREAEKSARSQMGAWDRTSGSIKKYDRQMTVAGVAVVAGLGLSARAAEEANQANARLEQVFRSMGDASGEGAAQAEEQADSLSRLIGVDDEVIKGAQAKLATFDAVSNSVARQNGIFERATEAAADLAATGFGDMASASVMLGKALQDPVKGINAMTRVGVTFTAAEKDKIKTLVESGKTLDAQRVILGAVEKQVGGVAEASATSSAKFQVSMGEFQEAIGQQVLPAFDGLLKGASGALDAFGELPEGAQTATVAVVGFSGAALILAPRIVATVEALAAMKAAMTATGVATTVAAAPLVILSAGLLAAGASAVAAQRDLDALADGGFDPSNVERYGKGLDDVRGRLEDVENGVNNLGDGVEMIGYGFQGIFTGTNPFIEMDNAVTTATRSMQGFESTVTEVSMATGTSEDAIRSALTSIYDTKKSYLENKDALYAYIKSQGEGTVSSQAAKTAQDELNDVTADATDIVDAYRQSLDALDGGYANMQEAEDNFQASIDDASAALKENGRTLDSGTEKGRANRATLRGMADDTRDMAEATLKQTGSQDKANQKMQRGREELIKAGIRFGLTKKEAEKYATQLGLVPKAVATSVKLTGQKKVLADLKQLRQGLADITSPAAARIAIEGNNASNRAGGGSASGLTLLGERGPELVDLPRGAYVHDAGQTSRMLRGTATSGAVYTINVDARGSIDPSAVEAAGYRGAMAALEQIHTRQMQGVRR